MNEDNLGHAAVTIYRDVKGTVMVKEWSEGGPLYVVAIGEANKRHRAPFLSQMLLNNPLLSSPLPIPEPQHTHNGLAAILDIKNADKNPNFEQANRGKRVILERA